VVVLRKLEVEAIREVLGTLEEGVRQVQVVALASSY
jgi:hypothetical protein